MIIFIVAIIVLVIGIVLVCKDDDRDITTKELEKLEEEDREYWQR